MLHPPDFFCLLDPFSSDHTGHLRNWISPLSPVSQHFDSGRPGRIDKQQPSKPCYLPQSNYSEAMTRNGLDGIA